MEEEDQGMEKEKNHCLRVRQEEKITQCKQAGKSEETGGWCGWRGGGGANQNISETVQGSLQCPVYI
jgi:hypothetical protein